MRQFKNLDESVVSSCDLRTPEEKGIGIGGIVIGCGVIPLSVDRNE